ncbi:AAA family ATPase [Rhizobium sp. AG207R]|uniref:AAA family ATPase n=1 Tax=Rhizobium sp. AG207R TaxID=2802287 RepID=UPI0022ABD820|nr:AAA family ATPase [Rhizobium sp. AG207R]MCZ3375802.1 AAA family ATPase [Rhizobium sp. AG207R]
MIITNLRIEGYRGINDLRLEFDDKITVIVGRNGLGKSSILDATALLLDTIQRGWPSADLSSHWQQPRLQKKDKKLGSNDALVELGFSFETTNNSHQPAPIGLSTRYSETINNNISSTLSSLMNFIQKGGLINEPRPLMVYYKQDRGFDSSNGVPSSNLQGVVQTSLQGDLRAISQLQMWWDKRDAEEARHVRDQDPNYRDPQLEAVRNLIKEIDGFIGIAYSSVKEPEGLYFEKTPNTFIHVNMLSSGERSFIILLADLARRLQIVNPDAPLGEIPGIILIDEIELNLHPAWQSKIIATLRRVFRRCQFVITTHSPQVISSVESEHVRVLSISEDGHLAVDIPLRTKGQTSNYLLEGVFGSNERFPEIDELIQEFNNAIDASDTKLAANLLQQITSEIEGDPPELLVLRKRLSKLGGEK